MATTRDPAKTHLVMPEDVLIQIDELVGKRKRSQFVTQATLKELRRIRLERALDGAAGAWKDEDHPELAEAGTEQWVRDLRTLDAGRLSDKRS